MGYYKDKLMSADQRMADDWLIHTQQYAIGSYVTEKYGHAVTHTTAEVIGKALGDERRKCSEVRRITQTDVAHDMGWSRQKLSDIECGKVDASFMDICRLCSYYGITPFNLLAYGAEQDSGK